MVLKNNFKKSLVWCLVIFGMSNVLYKQCTCATRSVR